jgi:hypothetical protein
MSAIGSVIVIRGLWPFSNQYPSDLLGLFSFVDLPRSLGDTWKLAAVRHFTEADATNSKLLVDRVRTTATLATCITANLELWLASSFNLE